MLIGDFETTTGIGYKTEQSVRVYLYALMDLKTGKIRNHGVNIDQFLAYITHLHISEKIYFHNGGGFDYWFIIEKLLQTFTITDEPRPTEPMTMSLLIRSNKSFMSIKLNIGKRPDGRNIYIELLDSLSLIPLSIKALGAQLNLNKIEIPTYHVTPTWTSIKQVLSDNQSTSLYLTPYEGKTINGVQLYEYLINDIKILRLTLLELDKILPHKYWKLTLSQSAYEWWTKSNEVIKKKNKITIKVWKDLSQWYRGGLTIPKQDQSYKIHHNVSVYDINSMYPYHMYSKPLPIGPPIKGSKGDLKLYRFWVSRATVNPNHQPFIPKKDLQVENYDNNKIYKMLTTYPHTITNTYIHLTDIELPLFLKTYSGVWDKPKVRYSFASISGMYKEYIDYFMDLKIKFSKDNNTVGRTITKLFLNIMYGKNAQKPVIVGREIRELTPKIKLKHNDITIGTTHYMTNAEPYETFSPKYLPIAMYITAYSRTQLLTTINSNYTNYVYCDTDSIHLTNHAHLPKQLLHPTQLGKWKYEGTYSKAIYREAKQYFLLNDHEGSNKIALAGVVKAHVGSVGFEDWLNDRIEFRYGMNVKVYCEGGLFFYNDKKVIERRVKISG